MVQKNPLLELYLHAGHEGLLKNINKVNGESRFSGKAG
jgi:hypothetical protein